MFEFTRVNFTIYTILILLLMPVHVLAGANYEREKRWADDVIPGLLIGEPIYLRQQNSHEFLGILAEVDKATMAIVVVHGMGVHPDWGFISTLRQELFDVGHTTLSIQMPVLEAGASYKLYPNLFPEAVERLQLAVKYLKKKGYRRVAIVSHSNGSRMTRVYMRSNPIDVDAWVALSLTQQDTFQGIRAPIFDLYGEYDLPHVLSAVDQRKASFVNHTSSRQLKIANADHFFNHHEDSMIEAVRFFLDGIK